MSASDVFNNAFYYTATLACVMVAGWMCVQAYFNLRGWFWPFDDDEEDE